MKGLLVICSIAIAVSVCTAQEREDPYSMHFVQGLLQYPAQMGAGFTEKQLNRLGDRVSIALVKSLNVEDFKNTQEMREVLAIIRGAFLAPQLIVVPEDRKPAVTLLLLNYMGANVQDASLRNEIADVTRSIREKTAAPK